MTLFDAARTARENAYAPYSRFKVGAALRAADGTVFAGCNVENVAYPQGTCAEAGAIAALVAAGQTRITEVLVIADSPDPISPCGGCRQKLAEFAGPDCPVALAGLEGVRVTTTIGALLPGAFTPEHMADTRPRTHPDPDSDPSHTHPHPDRPEPTPTALGPHGEIDD